MDDRIDIPQSAWERLLADKRRLAIVLGSTLLVVVLVAGLVFAQMRSRAQDSYTEPNGADEPSPSHVVTPTPDTTGSADATGGTAPGVVPGSAVSSATGGDGAPSDARPDFKREPFVAYRLDGAILVAREDGTGARKVAAGTGEFALSPDGARLAFIDAGQRRLVLVDVATAKQTVVGPALDAAVSWAPDSGAIAYTAGSQQAPEVRRVSAAGTGSAVVGPGHTPRFSGDGTALVRIQGATLEQAGEVVVVSDNEDTTAQLRQSTGITAREAAFGVSGIVAVVIDTALARTHLMTGSIWGDGPGGGDWIDLPVVSSADKPTTIAHLCASPDGAYLAYAESGDDGYSRGFVYDVARKTSVALSTRRDTYPLCWSADGSRVLFVEGNAFQGEATSLMSATAEGFGRKVLVEGAGL